MMVPGVDTITHMRSRMNNGSLSPLAYLTPGGNIWCSVNVNSVVVTDLTWCHNWAQWKVRWQSNDPENHIWLNGFTSAMWPTGAVDQNYHHMGFTPTSYNGRPAFFYVWYLGGWAGPVPMAEWDGIGKVCTNGTSWP
jgi:hypothetical protein